LAAAKARKVRLGNPRGTRDQCIAANMAQFRQADALVADILPYI
jgi:hypothetical protein